MLKHGNETHTHTPKSWSVAEAGCVPGSLLVALGDADDYCRVVGNDCEANAALIAAAPELLVALEALTYAFTHPDMQDAISFCHDQLREANAAVAKAKGE